MLNKRLYYQQHHFSFPSPIYLRLTVQPSLGASCLAFCSFPRAAVSTLTAWWRTIVGTPVTDLAVLSPGLSPACLSPSLTARCWPPASDITCLYSWSYAPVLYWYQPCYLSTFISTGTWSKWNQNTSQPLLLSWSWAAFSLPPRNLLENHILSLQISFLSSCYGKERPETCLHSCKRCLLWQPSPAEPAR